MSYAQRRASDTIRTCAITRTDFALRVILDSPRFFWRPGQNWPISVHRRSRSRVPRRAWGPAFPKDCLQSLLNCQRVPKGTLSCLRNYSSAPELTYPGGNGSEEFMRSLAVTAATALVLAFAFPQGPVLAHGHDDGAVGRPLPLDGGPSLGSDSRGQSLGGRSERTEQSAGVTSEKGQARIGQTGETAIRGRSQTHIGLRHRLALHKRSHHVFAFHVQ